ncbi:MAG: hypothetical protein HKO95_06745 [Rhodobacteraceae bacterium]|nr:hypothetical protein [Alphaproteobacteria bacterium]NNK66418.1 hypothetical protein [Paracoccaceae bacterium]
MKRPIISRAEASRWKPDCDAYFEKYQDGLFDDFNQIQFVLAVEDLHANPNKGELIFGFAGVDGIFFCFLEGKPGVWAYYGIEDEHVLIAPTISDFVAKWEKREIVL